MTPDFVIKFFDVSKISESTLRYRKMWWTVAIVWRLVVSLITKWQNRDQKSRDNWVATANAISPSIGAVFFW